MEYLAAFAAILSGLLYSAWTRKKSYDDFMRKRKGLDKGVIERKAVDYKVVFEATQRLRQRVKENLEEGWDLYGNPFPDSDGEYCQAMVLYE